MDAYEATKVVFARLQALDPDLASKIMGMLLSQDSGDKDMIRLAFGPEHLLHSVLAKARADLALKPPSPPPAPASWGLPPGDQVFPQDYGCWSPATGAHRRSFSLTDADAAAAGAWKPCLYFARGYCKNGSCCRFLHGLPPDDAAEQDRSQLMASAFPFSPSPKALSFLLQHQQQQSDSQRAAAAAMLLGGGEDLHKYSVRSPRTDRGDLITNPGARQIYLTFPADSTFSEEDVSNYFSIYGPVQDVRIPYQQRRMFGFVTFVYPETARLILAKGNPHFVCDARVLVKPYKEKGKVPDKFRKLQHPHQGDFAGCTTPTGLLDSRDPFDLQHPQIGPRMLYGNMNMASHEAFLRRKLEEQQQAAELQQAIELQGRRFMGLQLLDLKSRGHHLGLSSPVGSSVALGLADGNGNAVHLEDVTVQDNKLNSGGLAMSTAASAAISAVAAEGKQEQEEEGNGNGVGMFPKQAVNSGGEGRKESGHGAAAAANVACVFQESGVEHNLPDSPFASPTKAGSIDAAAGAAASAHTGNISNCSSPHLVSSSLFPLHHPPSSCPPTTPASFNCPGSPLGMEPLGCEYRAKKGCPFLSAAGRTQ